MIWKNCTSAISPIAQQFLTVSPHNARFDAAVFAELCHHTVPELHRCNSAFGISS